jgi:anthranilate synthase/aminodeoxychorismate synthase-like glutamine amidotransferase
MITVIDNYDSFTYNLVQALGALGAEVRVFRNDELSVSDFAALGASGLIISPGPCTPREAGISMDLVKAFSGILPILGVCLGHQAVAEAFGAQIVRAGRIMHGKTSMVELGESPLYEGIRSPASCGRYHSLAVRPDSLPPELAADAMSDDGVIMGLHHSTHPTFGVQFHPESILTPCGKRLLRNFLKIIEGQSGERSAKNEKIHS